MRRTVSISLLAVVAFGAILIARLPASWVLPVVRPQLACASVSGSLWSGFCGGLTVRGEPPLGDLTWRLHPARLLLGKLAAHVDMERLPDAAAQADLEIGLGGSIVARDVVATLPLDPTLLPALPSTLTGTLQLQLALASITPKGVIERLQGRVEARNLVDSSGYVTPLGSFVVAFPGGTGEPTGSLHDTGGGPLAVEGTLRLTQQPGYELRGYVTPRASASAPLVNAIEFLGMPDAEGRRQFAVSGTY